MENPIIIEQGEDFPGVLLDIEKREIVVVGPSFPEDAVEVYSPIIKWVAENEEQLDGLVCSFDYSILSSASNKMVFELLLRFENMIKSGKNVIVKWFYSSFDEDMQDEGNGFSKNMNIPFEIIEKK